MQIADVHRYKNGLELRFHGILPVLDRQPFLERFQDLLPWLAPIDHLEDVNLFCGWPVLQAKVNVTPYRVVRQKTVLLQRLEDRRGHSMIVHLYGRIAERVRQQIAHHRALIGALIVKFRRVCCNRVHDAHVRADRGAHENAVDVQRTVLNHRVLRRFPKERRDHVRAQLEEERRAQDILANGSTVVEVVVQVLQHVQDSVHATILT